MIHNYKCDNCGKLIKVAKLTLNKKIMLSKYRESIIRFIIKDKYNDEILDLCESCLKKEAKEFVKDIEGVNK